MRPINDNIVVRMDPDSKFTNSGLIRPDIALEHTLRTGVVEKVGPGRISKKGKLIPTGLEPGEGVCFIRFHAQTKTGEDIRYLLGDDVVILKPDDVLFAYDRAEKLVLGQ